MSIEDRIRMKAHWKMRVWITKRVRCKKGFVVTFKSGDNVEAEISCPNKATALQLLFAKVRCLPMQTFTIKPGK